MRNWIIGIALFGGLLAFTPPAMAHPDATSEAGVSAYLISAVLAVALFTGAFGIGRLLKGRAGTWHARAQSH